MIKLSRMSDYAVVVLEVLNRNEGSLSATQIAAEAQLPDPTVAKVLKLLAGGDLVSSQRGVNGGYTITRPADKMTIFDIVSTVEGRVALTACVEGGDEPCALEKHCQMSGRWDMVNQAVRTAFEGITLADMIASTKSLAKAG